MSEQTFAFRAMAPGAFNIRFAYRQPWKGGLTSDKVQTYMVVVAGR